MTAVDWLLENLPLRYKNAMLNTCQEEINKAKAMEKEQIIDAWEKGYITGCVVGSNDYTNEDEEKDNGNYYYNQTYNQNK